MPMRITIPRRAAAGTVALGRGMWMTAPRRGFSPASLSGLQLWLAADSAGHLWQDSIRTTPAVLDGDPVGAWDDLSGAGNNVLQATLAKRPLLKLAIQNGKPVLRFDGVDDFLQKAFTLNQPTHLFVVARVITRTLGAVIADGTTTSVMLLRVHTATNTLCDMYCGGFESRTLPNSQVAPMVYSLLFNGASSSAFANGTDYSTPTAGASNGGGLTLGAGGDGTAAGNMDIPEALAYNRILSTVERRHVEAYLGAKYGVAMV